ncbi:MAG: MFS transporter, partial [Ancalomicrobiaceae bacterium]|nr:MFS transporter [Ancalomicrobiaceae bacterium]
AMDAQMYALTIPTLVTLWHMTTGDAGILGTAFLVAGAPGGWIAGLLADRYGRVRVLQITIIWFSAFTFLSGVTDSFGELLLTRSLQGLGFGAESAVGAVLLSETINARVRGRVVGAIQAGWAIGYAIAVLLSTVLFTYLPTDYAWRVFFFLGLLPALLVIWIRRNVEEAPIYAAESHRSTQKVTLWEIFSPAHLAMTLKATLLTFAIYGANYVMITWLPAYLKLTLNLSIANVGGYLFINILGVFAGAFLNGWMADTLGRRNTFIILACCQGIAVGIYTLAPINLTATLFLGFVLGTLQSGTGSGIGAYLAELFPTHIRGTALGFSGNAGRAFGAIVPACVGLLAPNLTLGIAMGLCACTANAIVVIAALMLPETLGRDLSKVTATNQPARLAA